MGSSELRVSCDLRGARWLMWSACPYSEHPEMPLRSGVETGQETGFIVLFIIYSRPFCNTGITFQTSWK